MTAICMLLLLAESGRSGLSGRGKANVEQHGAAQWVQGGGLRHPYSAPYWEFSLFAVTCTEIVSSQKDATLALNVTVPDVWAVGSYSKPLNHFSLSN